MSRKGSRSFNFILNPFTVSFVLSIAALGLVSSAVVSNALASSAEESATIAKIATKKVAVDIEKEAPEEPVAAEGEPAATPAAAAAQPAAQRPAPAPQPQGCYAARPYIYIPGNGMCMSIISVGLTAEGAVGTPSNTYQAGLYNGSAPLGVAGASFVDGHSPGAFSAIKGVGGGTIIVIGLASGENINYQVIGIENVPLGQVDMGKALSPMGGSDGLNLMTCSGSPVGNTYSHRFIVYSARV